MAFPIATRVIVNLVDSDHHLRGMLMRDRRGLVHLAQAELIEADKTTSIDGEVIVPRSRIDFVQVLPT